MKLQRYLHLDNLSEQDTEIFRLIDSLAPRAYSYATAKNQAILAGASGLQALQLAADTAGLYAQWADEGFAALQNAGLVVEVMPDLDNWIARADTLDVCMTAGGEDKHTGDHEGPSCCAGTSPR